MKLCKVIGNVTASVKHPSFHGHPLLLVQAIDGAGEEWGSSWIAVDTVQSGPGDTVLVLSEGSGVRQVLGSGPQTPIRSVIVAHVDQVEME